MGVARKSVPKSLVRSTEYEVSTRMLTLLKLLQSLVKTLHSEGTPTQIAAGIALGVRDFAANRRNLREIGLIQWDEEVVGMFRVPKGSRAEAAARRAYAEYSERVAQAFRKGLAGEPTTASDVHGSCIGVLNVPASPSR